MGADGIIDSGVLHCQTYAVCTVEVLPINPDGSVFSGLLSASRRIGEWAPPAVQPTASALSLSTLLPST